MAETTSSPSDSLIDSPCFLATNSMRCRLYASGGTVKCRSYRFLLRAESFFVGVRKMELTAESFGMHSQISRRIRTASFLSKGSPCNTRLYWGWAYHFCCCLNQKSEDRRFRRSSVFNISDVATKKIRYESIMMQFLNQNTQ